MVMENEYLISSVVNYALSHWDHVEKYGVVYLDHYIVFKIEYWKYKFRAGIKLTREQHCLYELSENGQWLLFDGHWFSSLSEIKSTMTVEEW